MIHEAHLRVKPLISVITAIGHRQGLLRAWPFVVLLVGQSKRRFAITNNTTMFYYYEHTSHMFHNRGWCNTSNLDLVLSLIA